MAEHTIPQTEKGEEVYVGINPSTRIYDQNVDRGLAPSAGDSSGPRSGNPEHRHTPGSLPMVEQNHISHCAGNVNQRSTDIPASTSQGSRDEGVNQEESRDDSLHEHKSTTSKSPTSPLSATDDKTETDVTDYDDVDEDSGMDINTGLPPFSG
ncbi:uncharacterized protein G6M90_00g027590 [Metarhizium brunneum]|uniref:Uncharacterized protein n=1 Tax=Metarhizium brunneum TaxID=500148 RepID=A0A7D5YWK4_9HYPO|nr:hypothetical protein G6M90_00g027590 [Metarhizium brunneum]